MLYQRTTKSFETAQHGVVGLITVFPSGVRKLSRETDPSLHILGSLSDANVQRILHGSSCSLAKFWVLFTGYECLSCHDEILSPWSFSDILTEVQVSRAWSTRFNRSGISCHRDAQVICSVRHWGCVFGSHWILNGLNEMQSFPEQQLYCLTRFSQRLWKWGFASSTCTVLKPTLLGLKLASSAQTTPHP